MWAIHYTPPLHRYPSRMPMWLDPTQPIGIIVWGAIAVVAGWLLKWLIKWSAQTIANAIVAAVSVALEIDKMKDAINRNLAVGPNGWPNGSTTLPQTLAAMHARMDEISRAVEDAITERRPGGRRRFDPPKR